MVNTNKNGFGVRNLKYIPAAIKQAGPGWPFNEIERPPSTHAVVCPYCRHGKSFDIGSKPLKGGIWKLMMQCPECGKSYQLLVTKDQMDDLDTELDLAESEIRRDLELITLHLLVQHGVEPDDLPPGFLGYGENI